MLDLHAYVTMNEPRAALEVSFPKALLFSALCMLFLMIGFFVIGIPMRDPLLVGFLVLMVTGMAAVFAAVFCFMLRCKIDSEGLWSAVPTFYQRVLRWDDVTAVRRSSVFVRGPFYLVQGRALGEFCLLPRPFLLKHPERLKQLIQEYAPADNIVRKELAA